MSAFATMPPAQRRSGTDRPVTDNPLGAVEVGGSTALIAMIGDPIAQVRTPQAINPIFRKMGLDIICVPVHVAAEDLAAAWEAARTVRNLVGMTVTLPHKQTALRLCDRLDPEAERVGAVNVVRREADGRFCGYQFDGRGFIGGLLSENHDPAGRDCLVIGAGGAAKAIAFGLVGAGAREVAISNRTMAKAEALADQINAALGGNRARASGPELRDHQLIVNATSLGMRPGDPLPLDPEGINATMLVAEAVAKPPVTPFLEAARERGATIHSGEHMVANQVALIAEHFAAVAPRLNRSGR